MEIWKAVKGYEGFYEVSSIGRIRSVDHYVACGMRYNSKVKRKGHLLKQNAKKNGYLTVDLSKHNKIKTISVHRIVAVAFLEPVDGKDFVNHKNLNKHDNRAENLEWCTRSENARHAVVNGAMPGNGLRKTLMCCETGQTFPSSYQAAQWLNETKFQNSKNFITLSNNIRSCCRGERNKCGGYHWKDVVKEGSTTIPYGSTHKRVEVVGTP